MITLSNRTLADIAHELVCHGMKKEQAIRQVAEQYDANYTLIAQCFPQSEKSRKRKKALARKSSGPKKPREKKVLEKITTSQIKAQPISRSQYFRDAKQHEKEMQETFELVEHLDDY